MNKMILSKVLLLCSDFISLFGSLFIALFFLSFWGDGRVYFPLEQVDEYIWVHLFTASVCVVWFWVRLRHYTYRKPFWFELKEIFRTLIIFFVIELSIIALSKLYVSRTFWILTWSVIFILTPAVRIILKKILIKSGLYKKDTVIIGTGSNAKEVYKALTDESYLGFHLHYFVSSDPVNKEDIHGISIINVKPNQHNHTNINKINGKNLDDVGRSKKEN